MSVRLQAIQLKAEDPAGSCVEVVKNTTRTQRPLQRKHDVDGNAAGEDNL